MAKGAANENQLGALHSTLTGLFSKVLERYELQYATLDAMQKDEVTAEMVELLSAITEPSPAMLGAISKFLKDNEIMLDTAELDTLSAQERRLADMAKNRPGNIVSIRDVPLVDHG